MDSRDVNVRKVDDSPSIYMYIERKNRDRESENNEQYRWINEWTKYS